MMKIESSILKQINALIIKKGGDRVVLSDLAAAMSDYDVNDFIDALKRLLKSETVRMVPDADNWDMNYPEFSDKLYIQLNK